MNKLLSIPEMQQLLDEVTYRPGWSVEILDLFFTEGIIVRITAVGVLDALDGGLTDLGINSYLPDIARIDAEHFYSWLDWRLRRVSIHEHEESFQVGGRPWRSPHDKIQG